MKFYKSYFKLRFASSLQYRAAALAGISTQFFFGMIYIFVYLAFYESSKNVGPMKIEELVSYLWLNQMFFSLIYMFYKDKEIFNLIRNGNVSYELTRPKNLYFMWYFKIIAQRLSFVTLRCLPILVIAVILPRPYNLSAPLSITHFLLFIVALSIGTLLMTAIITFYHVITIKHLNEQGITNIYMAISDLLSGGVVPIPFFPLFLQKIANVLPFRYVSDLAFRLYSGNIGIKEGLYGILIQIVWLVIMLVIGNIITNKNLKRIVVQGG